MGGSFRVHPFSGNEQIYSHANTYKRRDINYSCILKLAIYNPAGMHPSHQPEENIILNSLIAANVATTTMTKAKIYIYKKPRACWLSEDFW